MRPKGCSRYTERDDLLSPVPSRLAVRLTRRFGVSRGAGPGIGSQFVTSADLRQCTSIRRSVFTGTGIGCKALPAQIGVFCTGAAVSARSLEGVAATRWSRERGGRVMPPDHVHFNGSVNLADAESVMR